MNAGNHAARLVSVRFEKIGRKETPALVCEFFSETEGKLEWNGYVSPDAKERTKITLQEVLGWDGKLETETGSYFKLTHFKTDRQYEIVVEDEEFKGRTYQKVKWINLIGQSREQLTPEVIRSEVAMLGLEGLPPKQKPPSDFAPNKDLQIPF